MRSSCHHPAARGHKRTAVMTVSPACRLPARAACTWTYRGPNASRWRQSHSFLRGPFKVRAPLLNTFCSKRWNWPVISNNNYKCDYILQFYNTQFIFQSLIWLKNDFPVFNVDSDTYKHFFYFVDYYLTLLVIAKNIVLYEQNRHDRKMWNDQNILE